MTKNEIIKKDGIKQCGGYKINGCQCNLCRYCIRFKKNALDFFNQPEVVGSIDVSENVYSEYCKYFISESHYVNVHNY